MKTLADLTGATGLPVDMHLVLDLIIPINDGLQAQGDLLVIPAAEVRTQVRVPDGAGWTEVPPGGVELLRAEAGGNPHTLVADPDTCVWTADVHDTAGLAVAAFEALSPVYLLHREHGGMGVAPGRYVVRRQREQAPLRQPGTATVVQRSWTNGGPMDGQTSTPRRLIEPDVTPSYRFIAD